MIDHFACIRIAQTAPAPPPKAAAIPFRPTCQTRHLTGVQTPARDEVVVFITEHIEKHGRPPTAEQVRTRMQWKSVHSALDCVRRCCDRLPPAVICTVVGSHFTKPYKKRLHRQIMP